MKKKTFLLSCLLGMASSLYAQTLSVKVDEKGKAGYVNEAGTEVVPCIYDAALPFENGLGKVMKGEKFGLVNAQGELVLPIKWDNIDYDPSCGLYRVKTAKKYGLVDTQGKEVLRAQYTYISPFNCYGKALIAMGGKNTTNAKIKKNYLLGAKYGVLNTDGSLAIPVKWRGLYEFSHEVNPNTVGEGQFAARSAHYFGDTLVTDCKYMAYDTRGAFYNKATGSIWFFGKLGILDNQGNILLKASVPTNSYLFKPYGNMSRCYDYVKKTKEYDVSFINLQNQKKMKVTVAPTGSTFQEATDYMDDIAAVQRDGAWIFIGQDGNALKQSYNTIVKGTACSMWCGYTTGGECEFFDAQGKRMFDGAGYTDVVMPSVKPGVDSHYIAVKKDDRWGLVNRKNEVKLPFEYERLTEVRYGWLPMKNNGKWGLMNLDDQRMVVPMAYEDVTTANTKNPSAVYVQIAKAGKKLWYVYNIANQKVMGNGYASMGYFIDGLAWARPAEMKVEDSYINRSLSGKDGIDVNLFAYIIDDQGQEIIATPMPIDMMEKIRAEVHKAGMRPLSKNEVKKLLLHLSLRNRHYPMEAKIEETDWDY